jgi:opacity protein-like surface antigen
MKRAILTFVALVALATTALAQEPVASVRPATNDFRGRVQGAFEWEPVKNLSVEAGLQLRLKNDLGSVDGFHTSVGIGYEVNDHFSFGAEYILINGYDSGKSTWEKPRHRLNINLTTGVKIGRVELSLRERVQTTYRTDSVNRYEKMPHELILRSRLMAEYNIRHSKWSPYIFFELHNTLNAPQAVWNYKTDPFDYDNYITRYRTGLGAKYRITRNHRLEFYYYFDYDSKYNIDYRANKGTLKGFYQENEWRHTFGISYKFKL